MFLRHVTGSDVITLLGGGPRLPKVGPWSEVAQVPPVLVTGAEKCHGGGCGVDWVPGHRGSSFSSAACLSGNPGQGKAVPWASLTFPICEMGTNV